MRLLLLAALLGFSSSQDCPELALAPPPCPAGEEADIETDASGCDAWLCKPEEDYADYGDEGLGDLGDIGDYGDLGGLDCPEEPPLPSSGCLGGEWVEEFDESSACITGWKCLTIPETLPTDSPTTAAPGPTAPPLATTQDRVTEPTKRPIVLTTAAAGSVETKDSLSSEEDEELYNYEDEEEDETTTAPPPTTTQDPPTTIDPSWLGPEWKQCNTLIAAKDGEGMLIACGYGYEVWDWDHHCPPDTACHHAVDNDYMLCCPDRPSDKQAAPDSSSLHSGSDGSYGRN